MSELSARLAQLEAELSALKQIKTQEDFDEGARLHAEKNAPWVNGMYSDMKFPPYQYKPFPKMLYGIDYEPATLALDQAHLIPAWGTDDREQKKAIAEAQRRQSLATRIVQTEIEYADAKNSGHWFDTPGDAVASVKAAHDALAVGQAHREYEDRNMGEGARREMRAVDDAADDFTPVIPEQPRPGPRKRIPQTVGA